MYFISMKKSLSITLIIITYYVFAALGDNTLVFPPYKHSHGIRKAKQAHLFLFQPFTRFTDPQGIATAKMIARDDTSTEHDDDEVVVYGVNSGNHQLIYNTSMWGLNTFGKKGSGKRHFNFPKGVACDIHGNVYVVDAGNSRIVHLFNPKRKVKWVKAFNGKNSGSPGLKSPSQIGLDEDGYIYVTDSGNRRIVVFDSLGNVLRTIKGSDSISFTNGPTTIAVADGREHWSFYRKERLIFCADNSGKRLWKIGFDGSVIKTVDMPYKHCAFYGAVDYYHNFWVTDKKNHVVLKFDHNLNLLDVFGSYGEDDNQFIEPRGIAIWKRYGQTFIAEKEGAQYYWMGTDINEKTLEIDNVRKIVTFDIVLTSYSYISLFQVLNTDTLFYLKKKFVHPFSQTINLNYNKLMKNKDNEFIFRVEPTYSSYTYNHWDSPVIIKIKN